MDKLPTPKAVINAVIWIPIDWIIIKNPIVKIITLVRYSKSEVKETVVSFLALYNWIVFTAKREITIVIKPKLKTIKILSMKLSSVSSPRTTYPWYTGGIFFIWVT